LGWSSALSKLLRETANRGRPWCGVYRKFTVACQASHSLNKRVSNVVRRSLSRRGCVRAGDVFQTPFQSLDRDADRTISGKREDDLTRRFVGRFERN